MDTVLAAFDLSPMGRRIADRARIIAEAHSASLTLVHVGEVPDVDLPDEMLERVRLYRHSKAEDLLAWINSRASCPVELKVKRGNVGVELARMSKTTDLLVTGTSSVDTIRVGPRTTRLARKAHSPLLAVRRQSRTPYRRVIAAVDLSTDSREAVELAMKLAPDAQITAVVALPTHAEMLLSDAGVKAGQLDKLRAQRLALLGEEIDKFVTDWGDQVATSVVDGPPAEAVGEFARRRSADLVVASSRGAAGSSMVLARKRGGSLAGHGPLRRSHSPRPGSLPPALGRDRHGASGSTIRRFLPGMQRDRQLGDEARSESCIALCAIPIRGRHGIGFAALRRSMMVWRLHS